MLIQTPRKKFLTDLQAAITYAKTRPPKISQPLREYFGPGIADKHNDGKGNYRIQVTHWTDGKGNGPTVLVLTIVVVTADYTDTRELKKQPLVSEAEALLAKHGATIKISEMDGRETRNVTEPWTWLVNARWN